jgi:hypothetical protein
MCQRPNYSRNERNKGLLSHTAHREWAGHYDQKRRGLVPLRPRRQSPRNQSPNKVISPMNKIHSDKTKPPRIFPRALYQRCGLDAIVVQTAEVIYGDLNTLCNREMTWRPATWIGKRINRSRRRVVGYLEILDAVGLYTVVEYGAAELRQYVLNKYGYHIPLDQLQTNHHTVNVYILNHNCPLWYGEELDEETVERVNEIKQKHRTGSTAKSTKTTTMPVKSATCGAQFYNFNNPSSSSEIKYPNQTVNELNKVKNLIKLNPEQTISTEVTGQDSEPINEQRVDNALSPLTPNTYSYLATPKALKPAGYDVEPINEQDESESSSPTAIPNQPEVIAGSNDDSPLSAQMNMSGPAEHNETERQAVSTAKPMGCDAQAGPGRPTGNVSKLVATCGPKHPPETNPLITNAITNSLTRLTQLGIQAHPAQITQLKTAFETTDLLNHYITAFNNLSRCSFLLGYHNENEHKYTINITSFLQTVPHRSCHCLCTCKHSQACHCTKHCCHSNSTCYWTTKPRWKLLAEDAGYYKLLKPLQSRVDDLKIVGYTYHQSLLIALNNDQVPTTNYKPVPNSKILHHEHAAAGQLAIARDILQEQEQQRIKLEQADIKAKIDAQLAAKRRIPKHGTKHHRG